jgi:two-component system chemotaxis response regulator CheB
MENKKIKVLIVDDSSVIRTLFTKILSSDPEIEVVGTAPDPYVARDKVISLQPDVITLDIEMPRLDGISFLKALMKSHPVRTIVISSLSQANSEMALQALSHGAIDVMAKPAIDVTKNIESIRLEIIDRVKTVAKSKLIVDAPTHAPVGIKSHTTKALGQTTHQVIAIASSTGGTEALKQVLPRLPEDTPGILIVQHMPPVFTKSYAETLDKICSFRVKEAEDGDRVLPGLALLCPGNYHMELTRSGAYYYVKLHQEPALHGVRPAADYLMTSVAKYAGKNSVGVVLTGMGKDGAKGLEDMKAAGAFNIAQNEESCVVFGMPKEAIARGAIDRILPLDRISDEILVQIRGRDLALAQMGAGQK